MPVLITAMGRHSRQVCRTYAAGFPDKKAKATSVVDGLRTGDLVRAVVPGSSVKAGVSVGRLAVRATGSCSIKTARGRARHSLEEVPAAPTWGRVHVGDGRGASSPGLKVGVSAPHF